MKIFISDIDDTIFSHKTINIHQYTKEMIAKLQSNNIPIVFATARVLHGVDSIISDLDLKPDNVYIIASNGSEIYDYQNKCYLWNKSFAKEQVEIVYQISKEYGFNMGFEQGNKLVCTTMDESFNRDRIHLPIDVYIPSNFLSGLVNPTHKLSLTSTADKIDEYFDKVVVACDKFASVSRAAGDYIDIVSKDISKASALTKLLELLSFEEATTCYIGDSYNDIPLIEIADISATVGNGKKEVKELADKIYANCEDGGVGEFIAEVFFNER